METFNITPDSERKVTPDWGNRHVEFVGNNQQDQQTQVNPKLIWELKFTLLLSDRILLENFFNARRGGIEAFYWAEKRDGINSVQHTVKFNVDKLDFTEIWGWDDNGNWSTIKHTTTIQLRKIY
jgi:phage-related protein